MAARGVTGQAAWISAVRAATSPAMPAGAESCSASATIRARVVPSRTADRPLCRFVQRRACACPAPSAKITSPGAGCSTSPAKVRYSSSPVAYRTSSGPLTAQTSKTATGTAKASETALHRSTRGCSRGRLPSLRNRRSSDSEAQRYWVGLSPSCAKARRQAWISGRSLSAPAAASRDLAMAANRSAAALVLPPAAEGPARASAVMPSAYRTPATSAPKSRQIGAECWKYMVHLVRSAQA